MIGTATQLQRPITVDIEDLVGDTALATTDYSLSPTSVTFSAGSLDQATHTITLTPVNDEIVEADETVKLQISGVTDLDGQVSVDDDAKDQTVTIEDNDTATWSVTQATDTVAEGSAHQVTFHLDGLIQAGETVSVEIDVTDITATLGVDYGSPIAALSDAIDAYNADPAKKGTLGYSFGSGSDPVILTYTAEDDVDGSSAMSPLVVSVETEDDTLIEGNEQASITLSNPGGTVANRAIDENEVIVTIDDDDQADVNFTLSAQSTDEAQAATITVQLNMIGTATQLQRPITVNIEDLLSGTALVSTDYSLSATSVIFPAGSLDQATQTIILTPVNDEIVEADETVLLEIDDVTDLDGQVTIDNANKNLTVTIEDNDTATWSLEQSTESIDEADDAGVDYTFSLSGNIQAGETVSVDIQLTDVSATYGADYGLAVSLLRDAIDDWNDSHSPENGTLSSEYIDGSPDPFKLIYTGGTGGTGGPGYSSLDPPLVLNVKPIDDDLVEGDEVVTVAISDAAGSIANAAINDDDDDDNGVKIVTTTIEDNDQATVGFTVLNQPTDEAASATIIIQLNMVGDATELQRPVTVDIEQLLASTALPTTDYSLSATSVIFPAGSLDQATQTIILTPVNDEIVEADETVLLEIDDVTDLDGQVTIDNANKNLTVTIEDNDTATWSLEQSTESIDEADDAGVDYTFSLSGNIQAGETVSVDIQLTDVSATYGADYGLAVSLLRDAIDDWNDSHSPENGTLSSEYIDGSPDPFKLIYTGGTGGTGGPGYSSLDPPLVLNVKPIDDDLVEGDEVVTVAISDAAGSIANAAINDDDDDDNGVKLVTTTIQDNDTATWSVSQTTDTVAEGSAHQVTFHLDGLVQAGETVSVEIDVTDITATLGVDYGSPIAALSDAIDAYNADPAKKGTLGYSFGSGEDPVTLTYTAENDVDGGSSMSPLVVSVQTEDDTLVEGNEQATISLSSPDGSVANPAIADSTDDPGNEIAVTIADNDTATVSFVLPNSSVSEGDGAHTVEVQLIITGNGVDGNGSLQNPLEVTVINDQNLLPSSSDKADSADYAFENQSPIEFAAGSISSSKLVTLNISQDTDPEPAEDVHLELTALDDDQDQQIQIASEATHVVSILNDDIRFGIDNVTLVEGDSGTTDFVFTVTRTDNTGDVSVDFTTIPLSAVTASDFNSHSGTIHFVDGGALSQTITIQVVGDSIVELDEQFQVVLSGAIGGEITAPVGIGTIINDDTALLRIESDVTRAEGDAGGTLYTFTAELTAPVDAPVFATFQVEQGTATFADGDLLTTGGTIGLLPGQTQQTFTVLTAGDSKVETDEDFQVILNFLMSEGYSVSLASDGSQAATGTIANDDQNTAPRAGDDYAIQTSEETAILIDVAGNDSDSDGEIDRNSVAITSSGGTSVHGGTLSVDPVTGVVTYTPAVDFIGNDSFTYTIADDAAAVSDPATVYLLVTPVNDPPVANDFVSPDAINEDSSFSDTLGSTTLPFAALANDVDSPISNESFGFTGVQIDGVPVATLADAGITYNTTTGQFSFDPAGILEFQALQTGESASVVVTFQVSDGQFTDIGTATFTVAGANDEEQVVVNKPLRVEEGSSATISDSLLQTTDVDDAFVTYALDAKPAAGTLYLNGVALDTGHTFTQADIDLGWLEYEHDGGETTSDYFLFTVNDSSGAGTTQSFSIAVTPRNDAPIAADDVFASLVEDTPFDGDVAADNGGGIDNDPDGDPLTFLPATQPNNGDLVMNVDGTFTYTPHKDFQGSDRFTYLILDSDGASSIGTVSLSIQSVNDAPVAKDDEIIAFSNSVRQLDVRTNDFDVDHVAFGIETINGTPVVPNGPISLDNGEVVLLNDGTLHFTPNANFTGIESFDYTLTDGANGGESATVTLYVVSSGSPVNSAPDAQDDQFSVVEFNTLTGNVITNTNPGPADSDADGDSLTAVLLQNVQHGNLVLLADGSFEYTPDDGYTGNDTFRYRLLDGKGGADTALVEIDVTAETADGPKISTVLVSSTVWTNDFRNFVDDDNRATPSLGYPIPSGTEQAAILPWVNVNQIILSFDSDVSASLDVSDFEIRGTSGLRADASNASIPAIIGMETTENSVILTLNQSIDASEIVLIAKSDGIFDTSGRRLNGEWSNGSSSFPSGTGAAGGDFAFEFRVLPGDVTRNGTVTTSDTSAIPAGASFVFLPGFDKFKDVDGSGVINSSDRAIVRGREGSKLL
jgi:VCBS repeat-containing protein